MMERGEFTSGFRATGHTAVRTPQPPHIECSLY